MSVEVIPVIVLNWNGIDDTEECVRKLFEQTIENYKIFVADNGSDKENVIRLKQLKRSAPQIELVLFETNLGFVAAHNILFERIIREEECEYILLLNNDAFPNADWAEQLLKVAKAEVCDMVSSKMMNYFNPEEIDNVGHQFLNTAEIIPIGTGEPSPHYNSQFVNVGPCAGAALYSKSMLQDVGLFDSYFTTGYEDAELGLRATLCGYKSCFAPEAVVRHKISTSIAKIRNFEYVVKTQVNIFYTYFKLLPTTVLILNLPFIIIKYSMVLLLNLLFGKVFFFNVMCTAIWRSLTKERASFFAARKMFSQERKRLSFMKTIGKMEFFLWFDSKRFYKHMLRGKKTQFEKIDHSSNCE